MERVQETLDRFITAFEGLRIEDMMDHYAEDATSFFPVEHHKTKLVGKDQIKGAFQRVIEKIRSAGLSRISLVVEDLMVDQYDNIAVATFHIRDNTLSRRTLVLRKTGDRWLITHLHASNAQLEEEK